jgi:hypothetical protein
MPWTGVCTMNERMWRVATYLEGIYGISPLCRKFGVSRKTG